MACAVSLLLNTRLADAVSEHWHRLADAGLSRSMLELGYPPHVTLAVYDNLDAKVAAAVLDDVFSGANRLEVTLTGIATFGPGSGVCYAALAPSPALQRLHETVLAAVAGTCRPHYQAGRWTPHCTLATGLTDAELARVQDFLAPNWPLAGAFEAGDLVEFVPVVGIKRWALS
jgi:2'-5' RNA ligase